MSRKVWKLGKFDKGINSHTNPKDIKDNEWAELNDVNVSKVGVAKALGGPVKSDDIHQTSVYNLISGKGLYKFDSDNSYMPSGFENSYTELENTLDGGGGSKSRAQFGIDSLVWLFSTKPTYGTIKFQLYIGSTPITDEFDVVYCDGSGQVFNTSANSSENSNTNVFNATSTFEFDKMEGYNWDDDNPLNTSMVGQILKHVSAPLIPFSDGSIYGSSETFDSSLNAEWFTWNFFQSESEVLHCFPYSSSFWDPIDGVGVYAPFLDPPLFGQIEHNHNTRKLIFDAVYDSDGVPNGDDLGDNYMMGFYKWDGYLEGVQDLTGGPGSNLGSPQAIENSAFVVPVNKADAFSTWNNNNNTLTTYQTYYKARLGFMSELIQKINAYSGGLQFSATFVNAEDALINAGQHYKTDTEKDDIYIECKANGANAGAIQGKFTYDATSGAGSGGGVLYTGAVNLLADIDRYGNSSATTGNSPPNDAVIQSKNVSYSTGGAMVLTGETELVSGAAENVKETWKLIFKGNPNSGQGIKIVSTGVGSSISDFELTFTANYANNLLYANAVGAAIDGISGYTVPTVDGNMGVVDSGSVSDDYAGFYITIESTTAGVNHQFDLELTHLIGAASTGVEDEQLCLISKTNTSIDHPIFTAKKTNFKIYSKYSSTWIDKYNNPITGIHDNNSNRYLNWYYTATNDNDPLFYDEGNVLRISETNFILKQQLEDMIEEAGNINEHLNDNAPTGNMWANPCQWIGYKDISKHFGNAFNYLNNNMKIKDFMMGTQAKIWSYTDVPGTSNYGLSQSLDTDINTGQNISLDKYGMKIFMEQGTSGGIDWTGSIKVYAAACYDDGSESLPSHFFSDSNNVSDSGVFDASDTRTLKMQVLFRPENNSEEKLFSDARINGVRLYYTHSDENFSTYWNLGKIDFNRGFIKASTVDITDSDSDTGGNESKYIWAKVTDSNLGANDEQYSDENITLVKSGTTTTEIEYLQMPKTESFEDINGYAPNNNSIFVEYKAACIAGRRAFIGNIRHWNGSSWEYYNDRMVVSPVNALDTFPYPDNILDLDIADGDEIISLASYGDKVIQFKKKTAYILNISTGIASEFFVEERHKWKGILNKNHHCITDEGIFWANNRGAWIYDGSEIKDLFILGDDDESQQVIDRDEWSSFVTENSLIGYDAVTRDIIILKNHTYSNAGDSDCYIYSLVVNSWTKGIKKFYSGSSKSITNFQSTSNSGKLSFLSEEVPSNGHGELH